VEQQCGDSGISPESPYTADHLSPFFLVPSLQIGCSATPIG
jgi:hypothetical protein